MSSNPPCAGCKFLRRKCTQECVFAPYFPPGQLTKFANVHRVFGASNVAKILNDIPQPQRRDTVNSLAYEAEARLRDPIYGCVAHISNLQERLRQVQYEVFVAKKELAGFIGPTALEPYTDQQLVAAHHELQQPPFGVPAMGLGLMGPGSSTDPQFLIRAQLQQHLLEQQQLQQQHQMRHQQQQQLHLQLQQQQQQMAEAQQLAEAQRLAAVAKEQELLRCYEQQQQQQQQDDFVRLNIGFDGNRGFNQGQMGGPSVTVAAGQAEASTLSLVPSHSYENMFIAHQQYPEPQPQHQRCRSDEGRSGPSS